MGRTPQGILREPTGPKVPHSKTPGGERPRVSREIPEISMNARGPLGIPKGSQKGSPIEPKGECLTTSTKHRPYGFMLTSAWRS